MLPNNTAVIFVSAIICQWCLRICDKVILLNRGESMNMHGPDVSKAIDLYYNKIADNTL